MSRRLDVFFYGLFMDEELLRSKGVIPTKIRFGHVIDMGIRIGERATLVPEPGGLVHGVVMSLSHADVQTLYAGLPDYGPEAITVDIQDGTRLPALCFNLVTPLEHAISNPIYAGQLRELAQRLQPPESYIDGIH